MPAIFEVRAKGIRPYGDLDIILTDWIAATSDRNVSLTSSSRRSFSSNRCDISKIVRSCAAISIPHSRRGPCWSSSRAIRCSPIQAAKNPWTAKEQALHIVAPTLPLPPPPLAPSHGLWSYVPGEPSDGRLCCASLRPNRYRLAFRKMISWFGSCFLSSFDRLTLFPQSRQESSVRMW